MRALKRLGAGNALHSRLNDDYLEREANYLYSGLSGWFLRQYLRILPWASGWPTSRASRPRPAS